MHLPNYSTVSAAKCLALCLNTFPSVIKGLKKNKNILMNLSNPFSLFIYIFTVAVFPTLLFHSRPRTEVLILSLPPSILTPHGKRRKCGPGLGSHNPNPSVVTEPNPFFPRVLGTPASKHSRTCWQSSCSDHIFSQIITK